MALDPSAAHWRKATGSGAGQDCVELAPADLVAALPGVAVRDSKDPHGPVLVFSPKEWSLFAAQIRAAGG